MGYRGLALEEPAWRAKWTAWLMREDAEPATADRSLASAISTLIAFDYVTANWDRWSGGNIARDSSNDRILFVDNDGAFYEHPGLVDLRRQLSRIRRVVRFSRAFVTALRALDDARLRVAIGDESRGVPLLSDAVILATEGRMTTLLAVIDAKIVRAGEAATLAFP
jgi:hypothetical protein